MARRAQSAEDFARYQNVQLKEITYMSSGLSIKGWMASPPDNGEQYPALIFNRGGHGPRAVIKKEAAMQVIGLYASWGYVVVASNYRGEGGSEGVEEWGAGDVEDAMACLPLLGSMSNVDIDRMGLIGGSRGGMMAFMMLERTEAFRAAVTFGAPTMIHKQRANEYIQRTMKKHLPSDAVVQKEAEKRSVLAWADQLCSTTPLLLLHGTGDRRVPAEHSLALATELQRLEHPYKLVMYDNADHVLAGRRDESRTDIRWWFDHYVKNKAKLPRTGPFGA